jgi:hypothetical protein
MCLLNRGFGGGWESKGCSSYVGPFPWESFLLRLITDELFTAPYPFAFAILSCWLVFDATLKTTFTEGYAFGGT